MIPLVLGLLSALSTAPAVDLDTLTPAYAAALDGRAVVATVTTGTPDVMEWCTVAGNDPGGLVLSVVVRGTGR